MNQEGAFSDAQTAPQEESTESILPGAPEGSDVGPPTPTTEAANDASYDAVAAEAQGDAMQSFLERNYGTPQDIAQENGEAAADVAQGEAMQAFIETIPAAMPTPPPGERGRSVETDPKAAVADAQERTKAKEAAAEELRRAYWEVQEANPELSPEQAVEVARDINAASKVAEKEGEAVQKLAAEATAEGTVSADDPEGSRGYEAYQKKFALELTSEIAKLTPEQRIEAGWKASNLGFQMEKHKNQQFENIFRGMAKTIGGIGAAEGRQNFLGRMLNAIGDQYQKKAERNDRTIQSIEKLAKTDRGTGIMTKLSNAGLIAGNLNRVAQIAGLSVVPGGAALALGAMATASVAEAGKESRLTSEAAMEKTRYSVENLTDEEKMGVWEKYKAEHPEAASMTQEEQSVLRNKLENDLAVDKAWDEAMAIMETAMKNKSEKLATDILPPEKIAALDPKERAEYEARLQAANETIDAKDLQRAYEERIADTLAARIERFKEIEPGTNIVSRFMTKAAGWMMERAVSSTQKKLEEIENSGLTTEEKNQRREEIMNRFGRGQLMKDLDRMLSQKGALDTMGALLWGTEKAAKAAVAAISIKNLYDMGQRFFGGPAPVPQESIDRFTSGGNALRASDNAIESQLAQESINRFAAGGAAARAVDNAIDAAAKMEVPSLTDIPEYTVVPGDNLTRILSENVPLLGGLDRGAQETAIQNVLRTLSKEEIQSLGIRSGNPDLIYPGETINMKRFAELISERGSGGGGGVSSIVGGGMGGGATAGGVGGGGAGESIAGLAFPYEENEFPASVTDAQNLPPLEKAPAIETDMRVQTVDVSKAPVQEEAGAVSSGSVDEQHVQQAQQEDWKMRDGGTIQTKTAEQVAAEYQGAQRTNRTPTVSEQSLPPRPAERPASPIEETRAPIAPRMVQVAEKMQLPPGVPEKYADSPQIQAILSRQQLEDRAFDAKWDEKLQKAYEQAQKQIEAAQARQTRGFTKPFEDAQRDVTRGVFNEMGRAVGRGTSKGLGDRIGNIFRREGQDIIQGIGRGVADMPRNAEAANEAQKRAQKLIEQVEKMREAARLAHETKQAREIENAIKVLERAKRI